MTAALATHDHAYPDEFLAARVADNHFSSLAIRKS